MAGRCGLALVSLLLLASGCALQDVKLKQPPVGLKAPIPGGNQRQVILVVPFADGRAIKDRCGVQKGGYGNETAIAVCEGDPMRWLAEMLAAELRASGFTVLTDASGARESAVRLEGVVLRVFAEPVVGFWSTDVETDLHVRLIATSRTGLHAERAFFAKGVLTSVIWPQGVFNDSAERGTRQLLTQMVQAILELMNRYPELGWDGRPALRLAAPRAAGIGWTTTVDPEAAR